jgi:hypothetical protein
VRQALQGLTELQERKGLQGLEPQEQQGLWEPQAPQEELQERQGLWVLLGQQEEQQEQLAWRVPQVHKEPQET